MNENELIFINKLNSAKNNYPFIQNGVITINDNEPSPINNIYKNSELLAKAIEKMVGKYDKTLEVLFSGEMIKYTILFNRIRRSKYGTGCDISYNTKVNSFIYLTRMKVSESVLISYTEKISQMSTVIL